MNIHEYQAKALLKAAGAAVPAGEPATSAEEAARIYDVLGGGLMVVKAQVHAGGRGKGVAVKPSDPSNPVADLATAYEIACGRAAAPEGVRRGVKLVRSREEARQVAEGLLGATLVTYQTGPSGSPVHTVLVTVGHDIDRELYLGMTVDRTLKRPVLIASTEGGVDIETVAAQTPEKIHREPIDVGLRLRDFQARKVARALGLTGDAAKNGQKFLAALVDLFLDKDVALAEINPLIVTKDHQVLALDAKISFDDNALFRHPEIAAMRDVQEEDPAELRAAQAGLSYVSLDGDIACLVNGAGLAMSTMDIIKYHGGAPANFLDVGGGASKEQVQEGFRILLASPRVKAVLVNIFGGIMRCDTIAGALLAAYDELQFNLPLVVRLEGTNVKEGKALLEQSGRPIITADGLTDAAQKVVAAAKGQT
jgi:succinyl-CoA synthetase beta subunit